MFKIVILHDIDLLRDFKEPRKHFSPIHQVVFMQLFPIQNDISILQACLLWVKGHKHYQGITFNSVLQWKFSTWSPLICAYVMLKFSNTVFVHAFFVN